MARPPPAATRGYVRSSLRSALGDVPFTLAGGRWSDQLALPQPHGRGTIPLIQAAALGGVTAHTELTAGNWPGPPRRGQPIGVALPVTTARMLGLAAGDVLDLRDSTAGTPARLRVTGLFRVRDPAAPYWRLSLLGTSGALVQGSFITYGPMLVNPAALGPRGLTAGGASWLIRVDTARIPPAGVTVLQHRLAGAVSSLEGAQRLGGLQVTTSLPRTLSALASSLVVSRSLLLIGSLELILLALAAVTLAARLLATQREEETALLSARGVARSQLARASLAEATLLAVTGAAAGAVLGSYLARALLSASGLPAAGAVAAHPAPRRNRGCLVAGRGHRGAGHHRHELAGLRPAAPGDARARRGRQAALAGAARAGLDVALIALGVLAFWELRRYSAVPRLPGGGLGIDPVLSAAPAVALAGIALIPLRILPAAARLLDRRGARGRRLAAALAGWQASRRPQRQGGPVLLVVLAVATGTLALAQHQSWRQSQLDRAAFATGADVRVSLAAPLTLGRAGALAQAPGVLSAMPVAAFNSGFAVFALDARAAAGTVLLRPDLSPLPPGRPLAPDHARPRLPGWCSRQAGPARPHGHAPAAARRRAPRRAAGEPVGAGRLGHRLPGPGRDPARGRPLSPPDRRLVSCPAGALPAAPAGPVGELPAAGVPRSPGIPAGRPCWPPGTGNSGRRRPVPPWRSARWPPPPRPPAASRRRSPGPARWPGGTPRPPRPASPTRTPTESRRPWPWRVTAGAATLTFQVGSGHLIQRAGQPPLPVSGQLSLTGGHLALPVPAIASSAFFGSAGRPPRPGNRASGGQRERAASGWWRRSAPSPPRARSPP